MTVRLMSDGELSRLEVLRDLDQKRLTTEAGDAAAGARPSSGVPVIEGVPDRRRDGSDLEAPRSSQQPAQTGAATESGAGDHPQVVLGFRSDLGGREATRGPWDHARS